MRRAVEKEKGSTLQVKKGVRRGPEKYPKNHQRGKPVSEEHGTSSGKRVLRLGKRRASKKEREEEPRDEREPRIPKRERPYRSDHTDRKERPKEDERSAVGRGESPEEHPRRAASTQSLCKEKLRRIDEGNERGEHLSRRSRRRFDQPSATDEQRKKFCGGNRNAWMDCAAAGFKP